MTAVIANLATWITKDPSAKINVFSFNIPLLKLLANVCSKHNWGCPEYSGKMDMSKRNAQLEEWKKDEAVRLLLMSMRAGGVGLNITEPNYCIIIDP